MTDNSTKICLVNASKGFLESMVSFNKYFRLGIEISIHTLKEAMEVPNDGILIIHNRVPENLTALQILKERKKNSENCAQPCIFVSEPLSEYCQVLFDELDLVWQSDIPIDNSKLYTLVRV